MSEQTTEEQPSLTFVPLSAEETPASPTADAKPQITADGNSELTLRALVSTKEAGVIIGKGGKKRCRTTRTHWR